MIKRLLIAVCGLLLQATLTGCHVQHADPAVAFLGDSITEGWTYPIANYGVHGNTTEQMMARFPKAISGKGYRMVVILGGTNDTLLKVDPTVTIAHLQTLGDETIANGAEPVLCEIPPIFHSYDPVDAHDYGPAVVLLNSRIRAMAAQRGWRLIDYYDSVSGHPRLSSDGVHMKSLGYVAMKAAAWRVLPVL